MLLDILSKQNSQTLCVYILQKKLAIMKYCYLCLIISVGENLMHYGDIIKNIVLTFVLFSIFAKSIKKSFVKRLIYAICSFYSKKIKVKKIVLRYADWINKQMFSSPLHQQKLNSHHAQFVH